MNAKYRNIVTVVTVSLFLLIMSVWCWFRTPDKFSDTERRPLEQKPELSAGTLSDGSFMDGFELYSMDQFPARDTFRAVKAFSESLAFNKSDNNGLFFRDGYIFKNEYPLNYKMLDYAADKFSFIYNKFLSDKNTNVYFSIIPDKSYFLPDSSAYLKMDYDGLINAMKDKTRYMSYIDIIDLLELDDYYMTDTHWRQEKITDIAERIAGSMNAEYNGSFDENCLDDMCFYGVYGSQIGFPLNPSYITPDYIKYLSNDAVDNCTVINGAENKVIECGVYNMEKAEGRDPYEMFLSGAEPLIKIENPGCVSDRRLVMFRDSFGSSLAPLLIDSYSEIILADIRYMQSAALGNFIDFENTDVLFIYSTLLLNNSTAFK